MLPYADNIVSSAGCAATPGTASLSPNCRPMCSLFTWVLREEQMMISQTSSKQRFLQSECTSTHQLNSNRESIRANAQPTISLSLCCVAQPHATRGSSPNHRGLATLQLSRLAIACKHLCSTKRPRLPCDLARPWP